MLPGLINYAQIVKAMHKSSDQHHCQTLSLHESLKDDKFIQDLYKEAISSIIFQDNKLRLHRYLPFLELSLIGAMYYLPGVQHSWLVALLAAAVILLCRNAIIYDKHAKLKLLAADWKNKMECGVNPMLPDDELIYEKQDELDLQQRKIDFTFLYAILSVIIMISVLLMS